MTLAWEDDPPSEAHNVIQSITSDMAHTSYGELRQLFETFTWVWEAGGTGPNHCLQHHLQPHQRRPRRRGPAAHGQDKVRCTAWLQEQGKIQQPTPTENSDTEIIITPEVDNETANNLDSSEAQPSDMILEFKCEQFGYSLISDTGHIIIKNTEHHIAG